MNRPAYQILEWDSQFFDRTVARILPAHLGDETLRQTIGAMRRDGIDLGYWAASGRIAPELCDSLGGFLADEKVTFRMDLLAPASPGSVTAHSVERYDEAMPVADLEALAVQSGGFSRFRVDPRITDSQFEQLYRTWVRNSIGREMADEVLVVREGESIVGFLTLKADGESGRIELLAVDVESRGKGYGVQLVHAAKEWFLAMGCDSGSVVTQAANRPACRLYQKCGFELALTEYVYHFWL